MLGQSAPLQGCMVARVARIRGNRLQVVTDELPENLGTSTMRILAPVGSYERQERSLYPTRTFLHLRLGARLYINRVQLPVVRHRPAS